jgi:lactoylglutathione lyase
MKLGYVIHYVPNVGETLAFYEKAFGQTRAFLTPDGTFGALATGETTLAFAGEEMLEKELKLDFQPNRPSAKPYGAEIAFTTEDVAGALARAVEAGAVLVMPAQKKPWGQTVAYVRDLNGALVELCTPMAG